MSCVENTNSIDLSIAGGMLEADLNIDPSAQNLLSVSSAGVLGSLNGGWLPAGATLAYSSADSPTFVATTSIDLTGLIPIGAKFRLVQSATTLYFIVTAITSSTITLYGGANYVLANTTITAPYFSYMRTPFGFSIDPANWTQLLIDTTLRTTSSPTSGVWTNPGSLSLSIPIGCWNVKWAAVTYSTVNGTTPNVFTTLSTANNSESDTSFTAYHSWAGASANPASDTATDGRSKSLTLTVKTTYFLNVKVSGVGFTDVNVVGATAPTIISATCAYL